MRPEDLETLWVFGYGSLLWHPGFEPADEVPASLSGYHRSFCMWSVTHRGSAASPGLVLALDAAEGARCDGMALRVPDEARDQILREIRERELITSAYNEACLPLSLEDGRNVHAVTYVINRDHSQYCGALDPAHQAEVIARAEGGRGPNWQYLANTVQKFAELGIEDPELNALLKQVEILRREAT